MVTFMRETVTTPTTREVVLDVNGDGNDMLKGPNDGNGILFLPEGHEVMEVILSEPSATAPAG